MRTRDSEFTKLLRDSVYKILHPSLIPSEEERARPQRRFDTIGRIENCSAREILQSPSTTRSCGGCNDSDAIEPRRNALRQATAANRSDYFRYGARGACALGAEEPTGKSRNRERGNASPARKIGLAPWPSGRLTVFVVLFFIHAFRSPPDILPFSRLSVVAAHVATRAFLSQKGNARRDNRVPAESGRADRDTRSAGGSFGDRKDRERFEVSLRYHRSVSNARVYKEKIHY